MNLKVSLIIDVFSYFVPTVEDRPRPPLAELEVSDVADWKRNHGDEESAKIVTEKSHFLKNLTSNLQSEYSSDKKPSFEGDFEKRLKKLKITVRLFILTSSPKL